MKRACPAIEKKNKARPYVAPWQDVGTPRNHEEAPFRINASRSLRSSHAQNHKGFAIFRYFLLSSKYGRETELKAFGALAPGHRLKSSRSWARPYGRLPGLAICGPSTTPPTGSSNARPPPFVARARRILYAVDTGGIRQVVTFLTEGARRTSELCGYDTTADACQGRTPPVGDR